jgi:SNF2 family DNA or RNA helicase
MEGKLYCNKCGNWVSRPVFNNLHQFCCTFIDKKPPTVPKVLVTEEDWRAEFGSVLGTDVVLKPWQLDGAKRLLSEHFLERDTTILADEMGLGKTLTTLIVMMMVHRSTSLRLTYPDRYDRWTSGVYLVVGPLTTLYDVWDRQPREYTHKVTILHYAGHKRGINLQGALLGHVGGKSKNLAKLLDGTWQRTRKSEEVLVVVTTYETCANDFGLRPRKGKENDPRGVNKGNGNGNGNGEGDG